ncbi:hypothetical protein SISNIDRAFT_455428 [Sistotremastrum niveocremeum HHB9708]|uniref:Uncharacterized protein n=1 Tax=Sistotremastrum niveocremeum HHB9708 TaxID=1314777 RepID=A0A164U0I7_9AGAM|nr:hypothetical protein SISNIDRAFT_455428 [Sistotremastrum niveocremeum HHB9708]
MAPSDRPSHKAAPRATSARTVQTPRTSAVPSQSILHQPRPSHHHPLLSLSPAQPSRPASHFTSPASVRSPSHDIQAFNSRLQHDTPSTLFSPLTSPLDPLTENGYFEPTGLPHYPSQSLNTYSHNQASWVLPPNEWSSPVNDSPAFTDDLMGQSLLPGHTSNSMDIDTSDPQQQLTLPPHSFSADYSSFSPMSNTQPLRYDGFPDHTKPPPPSTREPSDSPESVNEPLPDEKLSISAEKRRQTENYKLREQTKQKKYRDNKAELTEALRTELQAYGALPKPQTRQAKAPEILKQAIDTLRSDRDLLKKLGELMRSEGCPLSEDASAQEIRDQAAHWISFRMKTDQTRPMIPRPQGTIRPTDIKSPLTRLNVVGPYMNATARRV